VEESFADFVAEGVKGLQIKRLGKWKEGVQNRFVLICKF
jgi:hypothetical protein